MISPRDSETPTSPVDTVGDPVYNLEVSPAFHSGKGDTLRMQPGQSAAFTVSRAPHTVTIDRIERDRVTFTLRSTPQIASLRVGETGRYDVNEDGRPDIAVTVSSITGDIANVAFAAIVTPSSNVTRVADGPQYGKTSMPVSLILIVGSVVGGIIVLVLAVRARYYSGK
jgi:hypothetical protein